MSKLEDLLAANVAATSKLVKAEKGLGRDSEAVAGVATPANGQSALPSASKEGA